MITDRKKESLTVRVLGGPTEQSTDVLTSVNIQVKPVKEEFWPGVQAIRWRVDSPIEPLQYKATHYTFVTAITSDTPARLRDYIRTARLQVQGPELPIRLSAGDILIVDLPTTLLSFGDRE